MAEKRGLTGPLAFIVMALPVWPACKGEIFEELGGRGVALDPGKRGGSIGKISVFIFSGFKKIPTKP
ncbi:MAG: hypothetical protein IIC13_08170 [SAR324 cluster bacterium]|nr:hypothetical protein [SAR324 cluster bacterium]